jgi:hypothetical protein
MFQQLAEVTAEAQTVVPAPVETLTLQVEEEVAAVVVLLPFGEMVDRSENRAHREVVEQTHLQAIPEYMVPDRLSETHRLLPFLGHINQRGTRLISSGQVVAELVQSVVKMAAAVMVVTAAGDIQAVAVHMVRRV